MNYRDKKELELSTLLNAIETIKFIPIDQKIGAFTAIYLLYSLLPSFDGSGVFNAEIEEAVSNPNWQNELIIDELIENLIEYINKTIKNL